MKYTVVPEIGTRSLSNQDFSSGFRMFFLSEEKVAAVRFRYSCGRMAVFES